LLSLVIYKTKGRQRLSLHLRTLSSFVKQQPSPSNHAFSSSLSLSLSHRILVFFFVARLNSSCPARRSTLNFPARNRPSRRRSPASLKLAVSWVNTSRRRVALEISPSAWHATPNHLVRLLRLYSFFLGFSLCNFSESSGCCLVLQKM